MNMINTYSAAISCQQFSRPFARVPRFVWTILCFGVIVALALAGRNKLLTYLQNFLALLGYWCTSYFVIVFTEHYLFRKDDFANYDLEAWNDPSRLPIGIGGFTAFALGVVAWVLAVRLSLSALALRRVADLLSFCRWSRRGMLDLSAL